MREFLKTKFGRKPFSHDESEVEFPFLEHLDDVLIRKNLDLKTDLRKLLELFHDAFIMGGPLAALGHRITDEPLRRVFGVLVFTLEFADSFKDQIRHGLKLLRKLGGDKRMSHALKKLSDLRFEFPDLLADRGLGDLKTPRGLRKGLVGHDLRKDAKRV
jgi:hypothetical protein